MSDLFCMIGQRTTEKEKEKEKEKKLITTRAANLGPCVISPIKKGANGSFFNSNSKT